MALECPWHAVVRKGWPGRYRLYLSPGRPPGCQWVLLDSFQLFCWCTSKRGRVYQAMKMGFEVCAATNGIHLSHPQNTLSFNYSQSHSSHCSSFSHCHLTKTVAATDKCTDLLVIYASTLWCNMHGMMHFLWHGSSTYGGMLGILSQ